MKSKFRAKQVYFSHALNRQLLPNELLFYQQCYKKHSLDSKHFGKVTKFDSHLEFKVFQVLQSSYLVSEIIPHYALEIIPPNKSKCYPNGKTWRVDFLVKGHHKEVLMIAEAKGIVSREFTLILASLENHSPELFNKLWIIFDDKIPKDNRVIKQLQKVNTPRVTTLKQFQNLIT